MDEYVWADLPAYSGPVSSSDAGTNWGGLGTGLADMFKSAVGGWSSVEVAKARLNSQYSPYGYYTAGQRGLYGVPNQYGAVGGISPLMLLMLAGAAVFLIAKD